MDRLRDFCKPFSPRANLTRILLKNQKSEVERHWHGVVVVVVVANVVIVADGEQVSIEPIPNIDHGQQNRVARNILLSTNNEVSRPRFVQDVRITFCCPTTQVRRSGAPGRHQTDQTHLIMRIRAALNLKMSSACNSDESCYWSRVC